MLCIEGSSKTTPERQFLPQRYVAILAKNFMFICTGVVFWKSQRPVWHLHHFAGIWHPALDSRRMLYNKRNSVLLLRIASDIYYTDIK